MDAVSEIKAAQGLSLTDEDGEPIELELGPAMSLGELEALEGSLGVPLPTEMREALAFARSIEGPLDLIDFTGEPFAFEAPELFPRGVPIASDGFGNFWVADLAAVSTQSAPV